MSQVAYHLMESAEFLERAEAMLRKQSDDLYHKGVTELSSAAMDLADGCRREARKLRALAAQTVVT
jgi:hypothetical protein